MTIVKTSRSRGKNKITLENFYAKKKRYVVKEINCNCIAEKAFLDVCNEMSIGREIMFLTNDLPNIQGDKDVFYHVIKYLIENSIRNNFEENIIIEINCKPDADRDDLIFSFRNNNLLLDEKNQKISHTFFKKESDDTEELSLPTFEDKAHRLFLVSTLIKRHSGSIWLEYDNGTIFSFFLGDPRYTKLNEKGSVSKREAV